MLGREVPVSGGTRPVYQRSAISVLVLFSSGDIGGAERSITRMGLANRDAEVTYEFATLGGEGSWSSWARGLGISPLIFGSSGGVRGRLAGVRNLVEVIRSEQLSVVYAVGLRACTLVRLLKPVLGGVRIVHAIRTSFPPGWSLTRRYAVFERILKPVTDAYIANSMEGASTLSRIAGVRRECIGVIPNGIEVRQAVSAPVDCEEKVVAVVANLHALKGHLPFLNVVAQVAAAIPEVKFDLVGRDEMNGAVHRETTRRGLDGVVRFSGYQSDVESFLSRASVFVLPSQLTEGMPTSILEAQAAGLPVVAYDIGGISQLVSNNSDGCLIETGNVGAMARAIVELLTDRERAVEMGEMGRRKAKAEFSIEACAEKHAQVWKRLCFAESGG